MPLRYAPHLIELQMIYFLRSHTNSLDARYYKPTPHRKAKRAIMFFAVNNMERLLSA